MQQIIKDKENAQKFPSASPQLPNRFCLKNVNQNNSEYGHFFTQWDSWTQAAKASAIYQEVFNKRVTVNGISSFKEIKHTWPAGNCIIMRDTIITGIDKKSLVKIVYWKCRILGVLL